MFDVTLGELIAWLVVGYLTGNAVAFLIRRKKEGFGRWTNLGIGLVGALIGGILANVFSIELGLGKVTISFQDFLDAFAGSLLFLVGLAAFRFWRKKKTV